MIIPAFRRDLRSVTVLPRQVRLACGLCGLALVACSTIGQGDCTISSVGIDTSQTNNSAAPCLAKA
jgi:hypothetical protein